MLRSGTEGAALEAAAAGVPMLISDRGAAREYFGDLARYFDPGDTAPIQDELSGLLAARAGPAATRPVIWSAELQGFLDLPAAFLAPPQAARYATCAAQDTSCALIAPEPGRALLLTGGLHGSDTAHLDAVAAVKEGGGGALVALIEDAGPLLCPDLFPPPLPPNRPRGCSGWRGWPICWSRPARSCARALARLLAPEAVEIAVLPLPALLDERADGGRMQA